MNNRNNLQLYKTWPIKDLRDLINSSAALYGDSPACLFKEIPGGSYQSRSYLQLNKDIDAFGTALLDLGLKGRHIGVIGENRYEWILADLAVINGVGTVVPLDRELPVSELANLAHRAHLSAIVYSSKVERRLLEAVRENEDVRFLISMDSLDSGGGILSMKELIRKGRQLLRNGSRFYLDAAIDPDAMSILLFTSGTTGLAKGVMISSRNIVSNVMGMAKYVKITRNDVSLSVLPVHHTFEFTCNQMSVLYQGGTIAICDSLKNLVKNMRECRATMLIAVPQIFELMYKRIWKKAKKTGLLNRRRYKEVHAALGGRARLFITGAAPIDPEIIENFNLMGITMIQGYGLTESSPVVTMNPDRLHCSSSVGQALPETEIRIDQPDDSGIGEIMTRSDSVMLGYYENPEATAEVLENGWLRTGDYGYLDEAGFLFITGRKKNVIVTQNGKNIFPEEVEYYLSKSDYVREVIVNGEEDQKTGNLIITAHIVPDFELLYKTEGRITEDAAREFFRKIVDEANEQMPPYKRIKRILLRREIFERTSTNKIRRF